MRDKAVYVKDFRWTLLLVLLLQLGCTGRTSLAPEMIAGKVWLQSFADQPRGFYPAVDGGLLLIGFSPTVGESWELRDDELILWVRTEPLSELSPVVYRAYATEETFLKPIADAEDSKYTPSDISGLCGDVSYLPVFLKDQRVSSLAKSHESGYLRFNPQDGTFRGFSGVNNFCGSYQRPGDIGLRVGPLMLTKLSGLEMSYEMSFLSCLEQADSMLATERLLFFYDGNELLGIFKGD